MDNEIDHNSLKQYSLTLSETLLKRLEKHIQVLKHSKPGNLKKNDWLLQAFEEMMHEWEEKEIHEIPKETRVAFKLNSIFVSKLEKIIEYQSKFRPSYSKTKWFEEAIYRKLEKEEEFVNKQLDNLKSPVSSGSSQI